MRKRARAAVAAAVLVLGLPALAVAVKKTLYVKAKNTRVMASPSPTADVVAILQPGEQVTWGGAAPNNKQWHNVTAPGNKPGFVFQTNLSSTAPSMELVVDKDGKRNKVSPKGFVASGAAVKALSPGAIKYGRGKKGDYATAVDEILKLEEIAKSVQPPQLAAHVEQAELFPVVGPASRKAGR